MWQSQVIREWKTVGSQEAQRSSLLKVLRARFQPELPADVAQRIEQTTDLNILTRWFDAALAVSTLDAFRGVIQATPPAPTQNK